LAVFECWTSLSLQFHVKMNLLIFHTSSLTEKTSDPFQSFASFVTGFIKNAFVFFLGDWSWFDNWNVNLLGFAFSDSTATFLDKLNGVSSRGTVGTFNSHLSFNGLGGRAATALPLHFTVFVDSGTDTFTGAHVDLKVSFSFTEHTVDFNRDSTNKIGGNSATANRLFNRFSAFFDAAIL